MKLIATTFAVLFAFVVQAQAIDIKQVITDKGIKALLVEDYTLPIIAISISFKGGSSQDEAGKEGTLRLMTSLMDEGAGDLDSTAFQAKAEELGLEFGFSASRDSFSGGGRLLRSEREGAFNLIKLAINEPRFDADAIERMRDAIRSNIKSAKKNPSSVGREALREAIFKDHPYSRSTSGTEQSIDAITRDDIIAMNKKILSRETLTIGVVGAISEEELKIAIDDIFGNLSEESSIQKIEDVTPALGDDISIAMPVPNASISIVYPAIKRDNPDFFAAHLMNHVLGGGSFSSRLYREVREERGLAYGVSSGLATLDHSAYFVAGTSTRAENREEAIQVIRNEIDRIAKEGITKEELEKAKRYVSGSYAISNLDTSGKIASVLVALQTQNLGVDYIEKREKYIADVTLEDANRMAKEFFSVKPTIVVVGPEVTQ
jgi:zinc protease